MSGGLEHGRGDVDAGDSRERAPAGNGVDLQDDRPAAIEVGDQVDAGHDGPHRAGGVDRQPLLLGGEPAGLGPAAERDVRPPFARQAACRRIAPRTAPSGRRRGGRSPDGGRPAGGRGPPRSARGHGTCRQASSRSLMRTRPRPSEPNSGLTTTSPPSSSNAASAADGRLTGPGRRDGQPRLAEEGQRQVLVDGRLDGAGRVDDRDARRGDPVQGIHAEDDLLEAARRHHPHQDAVERPSGRSRRPRTRRPRSPTRPTERRDLGEGEGMQAHVEPPRAALEVGDVPAESGDQGGQRLHGKVRWTTRCGRESGGSEQERPRQHAGLELAEGMSIGRSRCSGRRPRPG